VLQARLRTCGSTRALARHQGDIDDAIHDAAVNALEHLDSFDPGRGTALGWLWVITRNCAISRLRRRSRSRALGLDAVDDARPALHGPDPAAQAQSREELALAPRHLDELL